MFVLGSCVVDVLVDGLLVEEMLKIVNDYDFVIIYMSMLLFLIDVMFV